MAKRKRRRRVKVWHPGPLAEARRKLGLTLREAAQGAGVAPMTISRAERGRPIFAHHAIMLARYYGSTVEKMFGHLAGERNGNFEHDYGNGDNIVIP